MKQHRTRLLVIALAWALSFVGLVVLIALERTDGTGFGIVAGMCATLTPALLDAARVESRRRTPGVRAISDDVDAPTPAPEPPVPPSSSSGTRPATRPRS